MDIREFNENWICYRTGMKEMAFAVSLPHDAMLLDEKSDTSVAGVNTGWIDAQDYTYEKTFYVPDSWRNLESVLYFEGVYHKARIYINGKKVFYHEYGYTGFYVELKDYIQYEEENVVLVEVTNSDQPNSRWYSGTGIYRPVWLYLMPARHILLRGIRIKTLSYKLPKIAVNVKTNAPGTVRIEILNGNRKVFASRDAITNGELMVELELENAELWEIDHPVLYTCRVSFGEDVQEERFGIRMLAWNAAEGFTMNGTRIILKGACIHHDNGVLGACAYEFAERRKIRILKENGYNAVRSAHNPCSEAMLRACDEMGMLVMNEYVDVWYIHKTKYDYAGNVEEHYKEDLKFLADVSYNHPSVVLYSTGNEVSETAQKRGIALTSAMTEYLHTQDPTRPVTCGINIFFNFLSSMGFGVYSDEKAEKEITGNGKKKAVGSEFFNNLAGFMGAGFMKFGATLYPCDVKTRDAFNAMDIAGYNYGINRYRKDMKKYPNRLILGSETFCSDAYQFWELAKRYKHIIGDFVWAGMDYLGEVGVGSWEYKDYAPDFSHGKGWVSAGSGRIDLTGKPLAEMAYTQVAFEQKEIAIGVVPVPYTREKHSPSAWKMSNAIESWSWNGCDGMEAEVEVYARADRVELYLNEKKVGEKKLKDDCKVTFHIKYHDGELKAVSYDADNRELSYAVLHTAKDDTKLTLLPELTTVRREQDLCYVRMQYTDENGVVKPLERGEIKLEVDGGTILGIGSGCPFYKKSYLSDTADTHYGEAIAVIKPDTCDRIQIRAAGNGLKSSIEVAVV